MEAENALDLTPGSFTGACYEWSLYIYQSGDQRDVHPGVNYGNEGCRYHDHLSTFHHHNKMPTYWLSVKGIMVAWLHCFWTVRHHSGDHVMEHSHGDWEAESKGEGARFRPQVRTSKDPLSSIRFNFTSHGLSNYEFFNKLIHWLVPSPHDPTTFQSPCSGRQAFEIQTTTLTPLYPKAVRWGLSPSITWSQRSEMMWSNTQLSRS